MTGSSIGAVSRRIGVKIPTIRFYEEAGLLRPPPRAANGRRQFGHSDERRLMFVKQARHLGFSLDEVRSLLRLADHPEQPCESASELVARHRAAVEERLLQLEALRQELEALDVDCSAVGRDCRIVEALTAGLDDNGKPKVASLSHARS
jgi:DNA-binding transcriptional MerR regulator